MTTPVRFSLCICTYNRADLLHHCLQALTEQNVDSSAFEVLVINNNCTDTTSEVCAAFQPAFAHFSEIHETQQGLSHARNRAIREAGSDWIVYLDDDAKAAPDMAEHILRTTENPKVRFFGGVYLPWYHYGQPVWFRDSYASNKKSYTQPTWLKEGEFVSGGIMGVHREVFTEVGTFRTDIGMTGEKIAYGEENELQIRARRAGYGVLYDPAIVIYHVVARQKLNLDWFFASAFARGRDNLIIRNYPRHTAYLLATALTAVGQVIVRLLLHTPRLWLQGNYYRENWLIDVFRRPAKRVGMIYTAIKEKRRQ